MNKTSREIIFSSIPKLVAGGFRPAAGIGAGWIPFDYELEGLSGTGVAAGSRHEGGELTLDLGLKGWHRLHFCLSPCLGVRLDGEKGFRELFCAHDGSDLTDALLHAADMTGRTIHIATKRGAEPGGGILFYIRAEPCDGPRPSARNLIATEDGSDIFGFGMESHRDIRKWFYPYKDSDFFRILWDPRASFYHSPGQWDAIRHLGDRRYIEDVLAGRVQPPHKRTTLTIAGLRADRYNPWNCG